MINASELRIGNYILNEKNQVVKVTWINDNIEKISDPITLTKEWLLKAGFIKQGVYYCKDFEHNNLKIKLDVEIYGYLNLKYFNHIQYVHQLQNLYFALTGSELSFSTEP